MKVISSEIASSCWIALPLGEMFAPPVPKKSPDIPKPLLKLAVLLEKGKSFCHWASTPAKPRPKMLKPVAASLSTSSETKVGAVGVAAW